METAKREKREPDREGPNEGTSWDKAEGRRKNLTRRSPVRGPFETSQRSQRGRNKSMTAKGPTRVPLKTSQRHPGGKPAGAHQTAPAPEEFTGRKYLGTRTQ